MHEYVRLETPETREGCGLKEHVHHQTRAARLARENASRKTREVQGYLRWEAREARQARGHESTCGN